MKKEMFVVWNADAGKLESAEPMKFVAANRLADRRERKTRDLMLVMPA